MKRKRNTVTLGRIVGMVAAAGLVLAVCQAMPAFAQNNPDPNKNPAQFDFADSFYVNNGMDLNHINAAADARMCVNVPQTNPDGSRNWVRDSTNTSPIHNDCRVNQVIAVFDRNGNIAFFNAMAVLANSDSFADLTDPNSIGSQTHAIGNSFRAFFFPTQVPGGNTLAPTGGLATKPCSPISSSGNNCVTLTAAEGAQREERVFDTDTTYFCRDLLNLWRITYVIFTSKAFTTQGQAILAPFKAANGTNKDGTPILNKTVDIDNLAAQGIVQEIQPTETGADGIGWIVCVVLADPTNGTITPDAFLVTVNFANGQPVSPQFQTQFNCLKSTGQFCSP
jgi:hypothetical protein